MRLSKYLYIFKNGWQYQLEYRLNTIIRFLIAFISLISIFYLWSSVYGEKVSLMGYSKESIITYFILIGYLTASIYTYPSIDSEIRDGTLSIYLTKPIKYMFMHYWKELSKAVFRLITALPILLLIFFIFKDSIYFVKDPVQYLILILTIFGAFNILFLINILVSLLEFWIMHCSSVKMITDVIQGFFAGVAIPLFFLPNYIQTIGNYLPFKYTGFFIVDSFLSRVSLQNIIFGLSIQLFWIITLLIIAKLMWHKGLKRHEAFGG